MATLFQPSFYSNPGKEEPATLVVMRSNPPVADGPGLRWRAPDNTLIHLSYDDYGITILEPEENAGIRIVPGTEGYSAYIQAMIKDFDENASYYEKYVNWPEWREQLDVALKKGLFVPETAKAVDAAGKEVKTPTEPGGKEEINVGLVIAAGMLGVAVIGFSLYFATRKAR